MMKMKNWHVQHFPLTWNDLFQEQLTIDSYKATIPLVHDVTVYHLTAS